MYTNKLGNLEVYKKSVRLSGLAWIVYSKLPKQYQFTIGDQFLRAVDSIGANIAEGYGRFHYKDSIRFYYISRGSLFESKHWLYLLQQRDLITKETAELFMIKLEEAGVSINSFIKGIKSCSDYND